MTPNPTYTEAPPNRETFVFAQLCQETTGIDLEKATIINLYDNSDNIQPLDISFNQFMAYFYPDGHNFSINCDASGTRVDNVPMTQTFGGGDFMRLDAWVRASVLESEAGAGGAGGADASGVQFELAPEVLKRWANDLGVGKDCWTPCSLMNITKELLRANYVCNFACDVCCSVSTFELAQALNSQGNQGALLNGAQYDGRTAEKPVKKGDCLALSILFTNPNVGVRPIDVRLNFCIVGSFEKKKVALTSQFLNTHGFSTLFADDEQTAKDIATKIAAENPQDIKNTWMVYVYNATNDEISYIDLENIDSGGQILVLNDSVQNFAIVTDPAWKATISPINFSAEAE